MRIATQTVSLDDDSLDDFLAFYKAVEDHDDVQEVYANLEVDGDAELEEVLSATC